MQLKRPVVLKVIVTEQFKEELAKEVQEAIDRVEAAMQQLDFQSRRYMLEMQKTNLNQAMAFRQQIEAEKQRHESVKKELLEQLETAKNLELGSEFVRGTIEGFVDVRPGENLYERLSGAEIVVKDGVIQEVRGE